MQVAVEQPLAAARAEQPRRRPALDPEAERRALARIKRPPRGELEYELFAPAPYGEDERHRAPGERPQRLQRPGARRLHAPGTHIVGGRVRVAEPPPRPVASRCAGISILPGLTARPPVRRGAGAGAGIGAPARWARAPAPAGRLPPPRRARRDRRDGAADSRGSRPAGGSRRESTARPSAICAASHRARSCSFSVTTSPCASTRAIRCESCSSISASRPAASGSSGMSAASSRPRRIASPQSRRGSAPRHRWRHSPR